MKTKDILLPEPEWILLSEQTGAIALLKKRVGDSLDLLSELDKLANVKDQDTYNQIKSNLKGWIESEMVKDKQIKTLSAVVAIELMKVPEPLQRVKELFLQPVSFDCLIYSDGWAINSTALHEASNRLRSFAKTQKQIDRFKASRSLADFLNANVKIGMWSKGKFANEMVGYFSNSGKWEIYEQFILADGDAYVN
jgi:hypothetical protein